MNFFPNAVAFSIPLPDGSSFPIYWYGILIVTGALVGAWVATIEAKRRGIDTDHVWNALLLCLILGVIGARLYHVISSPTGTNIGFDYYAQNPMEILNFRQGGLGIYGAVAGGLLAIYIYVRYAKLNFWTMVDIAIPGLFLGQAIGRWGNFFNQELYGYPTTLPWGITIDAAHRLPIFADLTQYPVETTYFTRLFSTNRCGTWGRRSWCSTSRGAGRKPSQATCYCCGASCMDSVASSPSSSVLMRGSSAASRPRSSSGWR